MTTPNAYERDLDARIAATAADLHQITAYVRALTMAHLDALAEDAGRELAAIRGVSEARKREVAALKQGGQRLADALAREVETNRGLAAEVATAREENRQFRRAREEDMAAHTDTALFHAAEAIRVALEAEPAPVSVEYALEETERIDVDAGLLLALVRASEAEFSRRLVAAPDWIAREHAALAGDVAAEGAGCGACGPVCGPECGIPHGPMAPDGRPS